jgi:trk system potassium uptake protein TrkH
MLHLRPIFFVVSSLLVILALAMLLPALVDLAVANPDWKVFAVSSGCTLAFAGMAFLATRGGKPELGIREAFLLTTLSWVALSAFAALPFTFSALKLSYSDAFFEAMSGLTTTGSTVLVGLDGMPPGILLWRSLIQWLGGIGIIVLGIAILPFLRVGGMQLFRTESSDRSEKIMARPNDFARAIGGVYLGLTLLCAFAYYLAGMSGFDALNHAMTTLATGGFSTSDGSLGSFPAATHWIAVLFMIVGALPFVLYLKALQGSPGALLRDSQVKLLLTFVFVAILFVTIWLRITQEVAFFEALRLVALSIVSIVTTTGFAVTDYGLWGSYAIVFFFLLTFIGGCTGSTSGGIKIFRFLILWVTVKGLLHNLRFPHRIVKQTYEGRPVPMDVQTAVIAFFACLIASFALLTLSLSLLGLDPLSALSGAAQAIANVGPGLGPEIGPAGNFAGLPDAAKWLLSAGMLLGRLELFTVLVLFLPSFWKE